MRARALATALGLALALAAPGARGEETIVTGLSQNRVAITANFDGSEILIYGAVKRDAPPPSQAPMEVIITVEGPATPLVIRRKERVAGIWINQGAVSVEAAPTFYAVATTGPVNAILTETEDLRFKITIPHAIRAVGATAEAEDAESYVDALQRLRLAEGRYRMAEGWVVFTDQTLFRTDVRLPANLTEGDYRVRLFLVREGKVVDHQERMIGVRKAGLERFLFNMAHRQPFLYGVASLLLAVVAGWAASAGARFLRG